MIKSISENMKCEYGTLKLIYEDICILKKI